MLKTVSTIGFTGSLTYKGTWDANANSPTLVSSVGTLNNYYVVSVAGNTTLNGVSNWNIGDWAIFNGTVWEKIDGSSLGTMAYQNSNNVTITGGTINVQTTNLASTTSSTATYGTASLPLQPLGFLEVDLNGTVVKVPYYAM
jgi:hypothetical protein